MKIKLFKRQLKTIGKHYLANFSLFFKEERFPKNHSFWNEGDQPKNFFLLKSG